MSSNNFFTATTSTPLPFTVSVEPPAVTVVVGGRALLACRLTPKSLLGEAVAALEWYRADGRPLPPTAVVGQRGATLAMDPAAAADDGEYVCSGSDGYRTEIDSGFIIVKGDFNLYSSLCYLSLTFKSYNCFSKTYLNQIDLNKDKWL